MGGGGGVREVTMATRTSKVATLQHHRTSPRSRLGFFFLCFLLLVVHDGNKPREESVDRRRIGKRKVERIFFKRKSPVK
ncbi:hypothetical protein IE53DRAFT_104374 [Violaceomyces palustris]|uniref:Uncharacterized protein n=1 Tax=Violaceomyces palustris TaxID=1673888 RepID=A0ACD0P6K7_9BASI|nr:hypothetical protein IE53DRAFT_104374 [Violaceomyces palustris]